MWVLVKRGKGHLCQETREQMLNFDGKMETKTIFGNREHMKTNFQFVGNRGTSQFISGEHENR